MLARIAGTLILAYEQSVRITLIEFVVTLWQVARFTSKLKLYVVSKEVPATMFACRFALVVSEVSKVLGSIPTMLKESPLLLQTCGLTINWSIVYTPGDVKEM